MRVIPVIDLKEGLVVHARKGDRAHYMPITSHLCQGSQVEPVLDALLGLYPFPTLYIADLDAIQQRGHHLEQVQALLEQYPVLEIWIDAGIRSMHELQPWLLPRMRPVIGSETLPDIATWQELLHACNGQAILSLDFTLQGYQGPQALLEDSSLWPEHVIVMSLPHVGSQAGPDFARLDHFRQQSPTHQFYAAGGTRHLADLQTLKDKGISGALIASALHDGTITSTMLYDMALA
ncbi:phosphoribosylformimino-5-aminoimidazole carboxamide ribotide isomerase [Methylobacillus rhizosphaerae]|uniref:Phosphoribosylformimino-5-aminoimidazole carboxamide ribotide isomerase n=1 Tax=Methylobacillus rhizosphaerae TaxID=551994 RepID=A0A238YJB4_9PROT|nr:HisA/HisF-related TIM barrel protein [Methylobacillus rhizosphaerae]SNR71265.1 phosphoribosylformimino-5-aminoimidazole carboxamide ribotide isomerase [Methylobacillus rhizosphaerae]